MEWHRHLWHSLQLPVSSNTYLMKLDQEQSFQPLRYVFIYPGCEAKASQKSELNHCVLAKNPNGKQTRKEVSVLDVRRKNPSELFQGKPMQSRRDWTSIHIVPRCDSNWVLEVRWKVRKDTTYKPLRPQKCRVITTLFKIMHSFP